MKKNIKKILFVVIPLILIILGFVAYSLFISHNSTISASSDIGIISVDKNNISKITITNSNGKIVLINDGGMWLFEDDAKVPVLQSKAMGIAYDVATVFALKKVEDNARDLEMYGLSPSVAEVSVVMNDGSSYSILTGNRLDNSSGFYLKSGANNAVYVVDIGKGQNFKVSKDELVDYDLSDISRETIKSITLCNSDNEQIISEHYSVVDGIVEWVMTYPTRWPVSSAEFESKIVYPVVTLKADEFIVDKNFDNEKFIKDNPSYVGVTGVNNKSTFFRMASPSGNTVLLYADGQHYLANVTSKISSVTTIKPIDIISPKLDFEFLGNNVKVEGVVNGKTIDNIKNYNFSLLTINEQIESREFGEASHYLRFYNDNDEICYNLYDYNNEYYAVSTDKNVYFSLKKSAVSQFVNSYTIR